MRVTRGLAWGLAITLLTGCQVSEPENQTSSSDGDGVPSQSARAPSRTFRFTYAANIPAPPAGTKQLRIWAPLPREEAGVQEVRDVAILSPAGARQTVAPDYGNRFVYVEIDDPTGGVQLTWTAVITRHEDRGQGTGAQNRRYLEETRYIPISSDITAMDEADRVVAELDLRDTGLSAAERAKRIYDDVLRGMEYDKTVPGYGNGDFKRAMAVCKGNCTDFHARFMGVARRIGLPVRFTMGIPMSSDAAGSYDSYHCWAHWYDAQSDRWKAVDISEADKVAATDPAKARWYFGNVGMDRLTLTYGRDLTLEPPQAGGPRNYMVFPYAEADGAEVPLDKSMWKFTYANVDGG